MGQQGSSLRFLACSDWARYVANSCHVHSKCGGEESCCELSMDTDQIEVSSGEEEDGLRICCL